MSRWAKNLEPWLQAGGVLGLSCRKRRSRGKMDAKGIEREEKQRRVRRGQIRGRPWMNGGSSERHSGSVESW
ncbi:hypothetical protein Micbo1qcDRAFT_165178, partial [Microdochium bolleyi]